MKILFAATGSIAVPTLEKLNDMGLVRAVLTSPDERGGRGGRLIEPPIKIRARELGVECYQMESLRTEARRVISKLGCDTLLSFCYGKIFGPKFLSLFEHKYNIHPSLLPKYRGCAPLYESIRNLDRIGGISIQEIALKVDSGALLKTMTFPLDGTETLESLEERVSHLAASFSEEVFSQLDSLTPYEQEGEASYSRMLKKEDGEISFSMPAERIHALIRASYPWPKAYVSYGSERLYLSAVYGSAFSLSERCTEEPGTVVALDKKKGLKVATEDYYLYVTRLQAPSRKEMDALSFVNGNRGIIGARLG